MEKGHMNTSSKGQGKSLEMYKHLAYSTDWSKNGSLEGLQMFCKINTL